jgi:hypothetical protein
METKLTREIKSKLLWHYRYVRGMYCVQECCEKDVLACDVDFNRFYEFEIKISYSDLQRELKKEKHGSMDVTYFYLVVPMHLQCDAITLCERLDKRYGVIVYDAGFSTARRAKKLRVASPYLERAIVLKMSSDYVKWYGEIQMHRNDKQIKFQEYSPRIRTIYNNLVSRYDMGCVERFQYIEDEDTIRYNSHILVVQDTAYILDGHSKAYTKDWIQDVLLGVESWIALDKENSIV